MAEEISPLEDHGWWMERLRKDAKATRPEALRLADALETRAITFRDKAEAAAELRRLHAVNAELLEALKAVCTHAPRSSQQIEADWNKARALIAKEKGEQR